VFYQVHCVFGSLAVVYKGTLVLVKSVSEISASLPHICLSTVWAGQFIDTYVLCFDSTILYHLIE